MTVHFSIPQNALIVYTRSQLHTTNFSPKTFLSALHKCTVDDGVNILLINNEIYY